MGRIEYESVKSIVEGLLPKTYKFLPEYPPTKYGGIQCISKTGIEDDRDWEKFKKDLKEQLPGMIKEFFHVVNSDHKNFVVYFKSIRECYVKIY